MIPFFGLQLHVPVGVKMKMIPVCSTSGDDTIGSFDFFWTAATRLVAAVNFEPPRLALQQLPMRRQTGLHQEGRQTR